jgi:hypothetical protein
MLASRSFRVSAQTMTGAPVGAFSKPVTLRVPS